MSNFTFDPAPWIPFRDKAVLEKCRNIRREDMEKHPNPDFKIKIVQSTGLIFLGDLFARIKASDDFDKKVVMIMPNPGPDAYSSVAELINRFGVNCRNVHFFMMDEWADEDGNIAPLSYEAGFGHSFMKYMVENIDPKLRMPLDQVHFFTNESVEHYTDTICEVGEGGADICYSGPGWAGHIAFVDPDTPEFGTDSVDEFIQMGARRVTLNQMTVAQNSLHGVFGCSGNVGNVPPRAACIGPLDVKNSRNRFEMHGITFMGTYSTFQRMISRLVLYGPVTPKVPSSILQLWPTSVYVSEEIAKPFGCDELMGY